MTRDEAVEEFLVELTRAEKIHPIWPKDVIHATSIMNEEAGESIRAALDHVYTGEDIKELRKELIQTGAMCIRCLINLQVK